MKIMLDTNVLISAFVFGGKVREVLATLFETDCDIYVSEYVDEEFLGQLRDAKDIPVLSDAIYHGADILLTGDKDFLEADIETPQIISPAELLEFFYRKGISYG